VAGPGEEGDNKGMLRVNCAKWNHTPQHLLLFAQEAPHQRTRERFLALYEITQGKSATQVAHALEREDETVHTWVHRYNEQGAQALMFVRTGGRPPFALRSPPHWVTCFNRPSSNSASPE
jgi:Homeodomain-like domain